jgi:hypothetical protein
MVLGFVVRANLFIASSLRRNPFISSLSIEHFTHREEATSFRTCFGISWSSSYEMHENLTSLREFIAGVLK